MSFDVTKHHFLRIVNRATNIEMTTEEFKREIQAIRPRLINQAQRYLGNADDAEDVVQDALLRMWQMRDQLRSPLDRMAMVVTRNLAIQLLRQRKSEDLLDYIETDEPQEDFRIERILMILSSLPPMQQTIFRLRHIEGWEMADIAELVGSNEVAVRKTLSRARKYLRDKYLSMNNDEMNE